MFRLIRYYLFLFFLFGLPSLAQHTFISFSLLFDTVGLIPQDRPKFLQAFQTDISTLLSNQYTIELNGTCFNMSNVKIKRYFDKFKRIEESNDRRLEVQQKFDRSFVAEVYIDTEQIKQVSYVYYYSSYLASNLLHTLVSNQSSLVQTKNVLEPSNPNEWIYLHSPLVQTESGVLEIQDYKALFPMTNDSAKQIAYDTLVMFAMLGFIVVSLSLVCWCSHKNKLMKELTILNPLYSIKMIPFLKKEPIAQSRTFHKEYVGSVDLRNGRGAAILIDSPLHSQRFNVALLMDELKRTAKPIVKPVYIDLELDLDL